MTGIYNTLLFPFLFQAFPFPRSAPSSPSGNPFYSSVRVPIFTPISFFISILDTNLAFYFAIPCLPRQYPFFRSISNFHFRFYFAVWNRRFDVIYFSSDWFESIHGVELALIPSNVNDNGGNGGLLLCFHRNNSKKCEDRTFDFFIRFAGMCLLFLLFCPLTQWLDWIYILMWCPNCDFGLFLTPKV